MVILFGLKNCDTCRKARKWLDENGLAHQLVDVRAHGVDEDMMDRWIDSIGWEALLNRRGTTWRTLPETDKSDLDAEKARRLMMSHPALIKRPVWDISGTILHGFQSTTQNAILEKAIGGS